MMDNATWLTAQECLEYGFATEIADQETDPEHPEQSAFGVIREAVLTTQGRTAGPVVDLNEVMQKLAELGTKIDALQKPEALDPEEDPEENVPETAARARAVRFFSFLTKED